MIWRQIHLKDIATFANLFLSFYSVALLFQRRFTEASALLFFNIMVLDLLDGFIARLTKKSNEFGKFLDSLTDFYGSSMIVPFFIYTAYKESFPVMSVPVAFLPLLAGVLRDIEGKMAGIHRSNYFIGLPRNTAGLFIVAYLNSDYFHLPWIQGLGLALLVFVSWLQLSYWPYIGNDKASLVLPVRIKVYLMFAFLSTLAGLFLGFFWDAVAIFLFGYIISPPFLTEKAVWHEIELQIQNRKP